MHLTQHTLAPHFHFGEETHEVSNVVSVSALVGLLLHTFVDGVAIASAFGVSSSLGVLVFVAILLHKFPEGLAISSLFLAAGAGRARALYAAAALGAATIAGVVLTGVVGSACDVGARAVRGGHLVRRCVESRSGVSGQERMAAPVGVFRGVRDLRRRASAGAMHDAS